VHIALPNWFAVSYTHITTIKSLEHTMKKSLPTDLMLFGLVIFFCINSRLGYIADLFAGAQISPSFMLMTGIALTIVCYGICTWTIYVGHLSPSDWGLSLNRYSIIALAVLLLAAIVGLMVNDEAPRNWGENVFGLSYVVATSMVLGALTLWLLIRRMSLKRTAAIMVAVALGAISQYPGIPQELVLRWFLLYTVGMFLVERPGTILVLLLPGLGALEGAFVVRNGAVVIIEAVALYVILSLFAESMYRAQKRRAMIVADKNGPQSVR
jgi:hypothetical protein